MPYGRRDYENDLRDPRMPHIRSRERFRDFYEELGRDPVQKAQQYVEDRMRFIEPRGRIIELGCHVGFNLVHYARLGHDIVGVDVAEELLVEARRRLSVEPAAVQMRVRLVRAFIEDLEATERFDTVLLLETLEHVIDPLPIVRKAAEFLAPNGRLYLSAPSERVGTFSHVRGLTEYDMIDLCRASGLTTIESYRESHRGSYDNTFAIARHAEASVARIDRADRRQGIGSPEG